MEWFRMYSEFASDPKVQSLSASAQEIAAIAHDIAGKARSCYPNWRAVEMQSELPSDEFMEAFEELCSAGVVNQTFPSFLVALAQPYPLVPMYGPVGGARPSASVWMRIRAAIFQRDDYTCQYCGQRGGKLECDHVVPVADGGGHTDDNLVTACFRCNRSKAAKSLKDWKQP